MAKQRETCGICSRLRIPGSNYCIEHETALKELRRMYHRWTVAFDGIKWERYLDTISKLQESGQWIKEVAKFELKLSLSGS